MLDKKQARNLVPLVKGKEWEVLLDHLNNLKTLALQELVVATSELEMYRCQGRINSLERLGRLRDEVEEAMKRREEN
jgi:hypothetical protein